MMRAYVENQRTKTEAEYKEQWRRAVWIAYYSGRMPTKKGITQIYREMGLAYQTEKPDDLSKTPEERQKRDQEVIEEAQKVIQMFGRKGAGNK